MEAFRKYFYSKQVEDQKQTAIFGTLQDIYTEVLAHTDVEFDQEEIDAVAEDSLNSVLEDLGKGRTLDSITSQEYSMIGVSNQKELLEEIRAAAEEHIVSVLWGTQLNGNDPKDVDILSHGGVNLDIVEEYIRGQIKFQSEDGRLI